MNNAQNWPDLAGRIVVANAIRHHILPVRVYFEDTDFSGFVYHASYVRWCERGRSDFFRLLGNDHKALIDAVEPAAFVVRRLNLEYLKPARIDDVLEVVTRVKELSGVTFILDQRVTRGGIDLCQALVTVVLVSSQGRVLRLSRALRDSFGAP